MALALGATHAAAQRLPDRLADSTFWRLMNEYSEPWGTFRSENFVSNETSLQWVIPELQSLVMPGGVYLGVAPDQNFTYIVALKPSIAFIVDIRHQNAIQHLLFKALIEMSATRAEFLTRLFSRNPAVQVDTTYSAGGLAHAFRPAPADSAMYRRNLAAVKDRLTRVHRLALSDSELVSLDCVYGAFYANGAGLTYNHGSPCANPGGSGGGFGRGGVGSGPFGMPTFGGMIDETDGAGRDHGYLASETNYRWLKRMEERNLIVPLTGNFAGDRALKSVGQWARDRGATVTTFYVSNVEQYLWRQDDEASRFYRNVSTLPLDASSTFIRSFSLGGGGLGGAYWPFRQQSGRSIQLISSMQEMVKAFQAGSLASYGQVLLMSRQ
ncbi:MAG: hypothetical protein HYX65_04930 [Gemmatimonadetes bacterium]|nr:hypothetical protein [Gemmatimonadota bacterium]